MEGLPGLEEKLFGYFVVEDHDLRRVARAVDFSRIESRCVARTPDRPGGIPPIPPLKLWKLYLVMFVLRIPSERELCRRAQADLAIRWFCGFGLLRSIPVHSTLSKFRTRMGIQTFQEGFVCILMLPNTDTDVTATRSDIAQGLRGLGVNAGEVLPVHSSLMLHAPRRGGRACGVRVSYAAEAGRGDDHRPRRHHAHWAHRQEPSTDC